MPQTSTCLWFDRQAQDAADYYVSLFPNSRIVATTHYTAGAAMPEGSVLTVSFELDGRRQREVRTAVQPGVEPAVSLVIHCRDQEEIDRYWKALSAEPAAEQCGWVTDRFGVSWQIVPEQLFDMLQHRDPQRRKRVMDAVMGMKKIDLRQLQDVFE